MSSGRLTKVDIIAKVFKMKTDLYNGRYENKNTDWYDGSHDTLDKILDFINEFST